MSPLSNDLRVDDEREHEQRGATNIFVRAKFEDAWGSYDIAELDRLSLLRWLRSRGGENLWAENTVISLLGHAQFTAYEAVTALDVSEKQP